ncbi:MAG: PAS-domain containing protein [Alphaproteobacteria bacterium]|nr:PAS-domain containing protein [Alphaproteobacteria bacterium]
MFVELVKGVALLLSLCLLYSVILRVSRGSEEIRKLSLGLLFGVIAIFGIMSPIQTSHGLIFDARSVVLSMAGLFGGPVVAIISAVMAASYRLWVGGFGAILGVWAIVVSAGVGVIYRICVRRWGVGIGIPQFLVFGLIVQIVSFAVFFIPGPENILTLLNYVPLPLLGIFTFATALLGWLLMDIEQTLRTEERLSETSRQLATVLEAMGDGLSVMDRNLKIVTFNTRFLDLMDLPQDQFKLGDPFEKFLRYNAMRGEYGEIDVESYVAKRLESARKFKAFSRVHTRSDGVVIAIHGNPLPDGGLVTLYSDITEQRKEQLDLEEAKLAAEHASVSKSQFLSHMSHELRTPLNSIIGFSEVITSQIYGKLDHPKYLEYIHDIQRSGEHLLRLINEVLDLSKIDAGQVELYETPIVLKTLLEECVRMLGGYNNSKWVRIVVHANDAPYRLWADDRLVKQVILNLLSNAVKYNVKGGSIEITTGCNQSGGLFLAVTDTGIGIAPSDIPKVLEPFGQVRTDAYRTHEGTGLGLSLSKQLTELHGGTLALTSEAGVGTTVSVSFPPERTLTDSDPEKLA